MVRSASQGRGEGMSSDQLKTEMARQARLADWIGGLEKRLSMERRFKAQVSLRREIEKCQDEAKILQERIALLQSKFQAS
jgi:hypothetical protein